MRSRPSNCVAPLVRASLRGGSLYAAVLLLGLGAACTDEPGESADDDPGGTASTTVEPTGSGTGTSPGESTGETDPTSADSTGIDPSDSSDSSGQLPDDPSPVFVALADGGWTATSCDGGQTWTQQAFSDEVGDHTPWTAFGGLAFGNDGFVAGFGWGAPGHLLYSPDGLDWEDLPADRFTVDGRVVGYDAFTSGVAFDGADFLVFSSRIWRSTTGEDWQPAEISLPPGSDQLRQLRAFPGGIVVAALENQSGEGHPMGNFVAISDDGGQTWSEGAGYVPECSGAIQHWGDIELRDGVLLVGTRDLCRSTDLGQTWEWIEQPAGADIQDLFGDAEGFGAVAGSRILHSDDGITWTDAADVGTNLAKAAYGGGAWAAVSDTGQEFFWSEDGVTWQPGTVEGPGARSVYVRDFGVGYPSAGCG